MSALQTPDPRVQARRARLTRLLDPLLTWAQAPDAFTDAGAAECRRRMELLHRWGRRNGLIDPAPEVPDRWQAADWRLLCDVAVADVA